MEVAAPLQVKKWQLETEMKCTLGEGMSGTVSTKRYPRQRSQGPSLSILGTGCRPREAYRGDWQEVVWMREDIRVGALESGTGLSR